MGLDASVRAETLGAEFDSVNFTRDDAPHASACRQTDHGADGSLLHFQTLVDSAPVIMWMTDPEGRRVYVNAAWCEFTGCPREEARNFNLSPCVHPEDSAMVLDAFDAAHRAPCRARVEARIRRRDGEYRWLVADLAPRLDGEGRFLGLIACSIDVTDAKRAEQALRRSEERFRLMAESTPAFAWLTDAAGSCIYVNRRWCEFVGRTLESQLGDGWLECIHPDDREVLRTIGAASLARGEPFAIECRVRRHDGEYRYVLDTATPHFDEQGRAIGVIGSAIDVTERRRFEERLRDSQKMEAVGQLAAGLAHDFGNLLTAIFGHIELARGVLDASHPARLSIEHIAQAATQASAVTRALLTFSRRAVTEKRPVELNTLVRDTAQVFAASLPASIALEIQAAPAPVWISTDPAQLQQALLNLALNARDAMPRGGLFSITIQAPKGGNGRASVVVRDTGEGMNDEVRRRAFEPFFTTKPRGQSTGLGLSITEGIIREMGGSITLESAPGAGTTLILSLPVIPMPGGEAAEEPAEAEQVSIVVVSDHAHTGLIISNALGAQGRSLRRVREAAAIAAPAPDGGEPDLVVVDAPRESLNPVAVLASVRVHAPNAIVILLVGQDADADEATEPRTIVVRKPISVDSLRELVRRLLRPSGKVEPE